MTGDLVTELMAESQQTSVMSDPQDARKGRRKRKSQTVSDPRAKRSLSVSSVYHSSASSSDDNSSNDMLPPTETHEAKSAVSGLTDIPQPCFYTPQQKMPGTSAAPSAPCKVKSEEVRLPLGDDVFLTVGKFREYPIVNVRRYYRPDPKDVNKLRPGKQGLALTPKQWTKLKEQPLLGAILDATYHAMPYDVGAFQPKMYDLGSEKYVTVQILQGQPSVTLHQHYRPYGAPDTDPLMKRGIELTIPQWEDLESKMETVDKLLEAMENGKKATDKDVIQSAVVY
ncbi:PREDICTED: uncharacterized protein LOC109480837 [Branchiostoma belcheri]|uniref:Activated RNA polymerase II transcriptional coactivator p15 n=1 Tax=Branchiostoma belcheri TaxID=7741 RepID=A0A6P4ZBJ3_BRABE|nr:PREDICTED: uncharacterized protein LOC109480837 [Branchiostoma belcheri]